MEPRDLVYAAELHGAALPHGLFPRLGPRFLQTYLGTFQRSPHAVALVATRTGSVIAFLVGVIDEQAHYRFVVRRCGPAMAVRGLLGLLRRPRVAAYFARTRLRRYARGLFRLARRPAASASVQPRVQPAVLAHIAVRQDARGAGAGMALVDEFLDLVREAGLERARLLTLDGDDGAGPFYDHAGWRRTATVGDDDGLAWARYDIDL